MIIDGKDVVGGLILSDSEMMTLFLAITNQVDFYDFLLGNPKEYGKLTKKQAYDVKKMFEKSLVLAEKLGDYCEKKNIRMPNIPVVGDA